MKYTAPDAFAPGARHYKSRPSEWVVSLAENFYFEKSASIAFDQSNAMG
jgi:hypothetical protein